jgi:glutaredoxin-like YruB-family protein
MAVKIYTTPTCPFCKMTKKFLSENDVQFEEVDVTASKENAKEMIEKSKQRSVPVIDYDGEIIVGYDKARLKELIK